MASLDNLPCYGSCIQCATLDVFKVLGTDAANSALWSVTVPGGSWKDGEMYIFDYALQVHIAGNAQTPRTEFVPLLVTGGAPFNITPGFFYGGTYLQLYRMIFRRIGRNLAIYDGDRDADRTSINAHDVLPWNSVYQSSTSTTNDGPQDFQSVQGAFGTLPDFTNDIILSLVVTPGGATPNVLDSIEALSPAGYKYTVK